MNVRIQRSRAKGWRMPEGAVYVGRPSRWGNPFPTTGEWIEWTAHAFGYRTELLWTQSMAVAMYRWWLAGVPVRRGDGFDLNVSVQMTEGTKGGAVWVADHGYMKTPIRPDLSPLRGHDLVCWCPLDQPCHADVLLELAR